MPDSIIKADNISSLSGGGIGFPDGSVSNPSLKFTNDGDTGLYRIGSNTIGISSGGNKVSEIRELGLLNGTSGTEFRNVLQIVSNRFTTGTSRTSNVFGDFDIPFNQTITVKSSGSRIIIICSVGGLGFGTAGNLILVTLAANGTIVPDGSGDGGLAGGQPNSTSQIISCNIAYNHLHGLSVGSNITYALYGRATGGAIWLNRSSTGSYLSASTLMLMEVI